MADLSLPWGGDFSPSATGGLVLVDGDALGQQRIIRRLLSAVRSYIFHLDYGAGIPQRIGNPERVNLVAGIVRSQIGLEQSVDPRYPPTISVTESTVDLGLFTISITYTAKSGKQVSLTFDA